MTRKTIYKISFFAALAMMPTLASATYIDCRNAGGSMLGCFWEAAMKDGNVKYAPGDGTDKYKKLSKTQIKAILQKRKALCGKLPIKEQKSCLMKGLEVKKGIAKKNYIKATPLNSSKKAVQH